MIKHGEAWWCDECDGADPKSKRAKHADGAGNSGNGEKGKSPLLIGGFVVAALAAAAYWFMSSQ
jgi:hypothetical protein